MSKKILLFFILMLTILTLGTPALASGTDVTVSTFADLQTALLNPAVITITIDSALAIEDNITVNKEINFSGKLTVNSGVTISGTPSGEMIASSGGSVHLVNAKLYGLSLICNQTGSAKPFITSAGISTVEKCVIDLKDKLRSQMAICGNTGATINIINNKIHNASTPIYVQGNNDIITGNEIYSSLGCELITKPSQFIDNEFFTNGGGQYTVSFNEGKDIGLDILTVCKDNTNAFIRDQFKKVSARDGEYVIRGTNPIGGAPIGYADLSKTLSYMNGAGTIVVDEDCTMGDTLTIKDGQTVTINTKGNTLTVSSQILVESGGTLKLTGGGELKSTHAGPAILNQSANTVIINGTPITGSGLVPGVKCENGRVIIESMPAGGVKIDLTQEGDSVEMKTSDANNQGLSVAGDDAMVTSGSTTIFYFGLEDALESAPANSTVKLTADGVGGLTLTNPVTLEGGITLDLNGHSIAGSTISVPFGEEVTVKSSSLAPASVTIEGVECKGITSTTPPKTVDGNSSIPSGTYLDVTISPMAYLDVIGLSSQGYKKDTNFPVEITVKSAYKNRFDGWDIDGQFDGTVDTSSASTSISFVPKESMTITAKFKADPVPAELKLTPDAVSLKVGETQKLEASESGISWSTSDAKIATVNSVGLVTAVAEGEATITATGSGNRKATCAVTVTKADDPTDPTDPTGTFAGIPASYKIVVGFSHQLAAASPVGSKLDLAFVSKNPAVCAIDRQGKITGVKAGKCLVGIKLNGKTYKSTVTVVANKFGRAKPLMIKGERGVFTSTRQLVYVSGGLGVEVYVYNRTTRAVRGFQNYALQIRRGDEVLHTEPLPESLSPFKKAMRSNTYKRYKTIIPVDAIEGIASKAFNLAQGELQAVIIGVDSNGNTAVPVTPATPGVAKPKAAEALAADEIK